jgi:hypothetical protein
MFVSLLKRRSAFAFEIVRQCFDDETVYGGVLFRALVFELAAPLAT